MAETETGPVLAFGFSGTHVASALIDEGTGSCSAVISRPIAPAYVADDILRAFDEAGNFAVGASKFCLNELSGISVAAPGPFDYRSGVSLMKHKHQSLCGLSLRKQLSRMFRIADDNITFVNDAHAFLLGEIVYGRTGSFRRVVGVTLGTEIGSAFAEDGSILKSGKGVPENGEIYNLPWKELTVEDFASTRTILRDYKAAGVEAANVRVVAEQCRSDQRARTTMRSFGRTLGSIFDELFAAFQPDAVVLGGSISRNAGLFLPDIRSSFSRIRPRVLVSPRLDTATLLGASRSWFMERTVATRQ